MSPYYRNALLLWIALIAAAVVLFEIYFSFDLILEILISTNIATFLTMGFDKIQASSRGGRIPERALYAMTLLGGSVGMLAGMYIFRHKTQKTSFQFFVVLMILIQLGIIFLQFENPLGEGI